MSKDRKISELPELSSPTGEEYLVVAHRGENSKLKVSSVTDALSGDLSQRLDALEALAPISSLDIDAILGADNP